MLKLLAGLFIKEKSDPGEVRKQYGILCGAVGILLNILLFAGKFFAGIISSSIAITADAFNNLSDAGSSCVSLLGFKLAGAKPDTDHPFGHGRIEYVSGLVIAAAILLMAVELIKSSISKIQNPTVNQFSVLIIGILLVSIAVKGYMAFYNTRLGTKIDSASMKATAFDSLSDMVATSVVLISTLVGHFAGIVIDGYCGLLVGLFVFYAGIKAGIETINPLLGKRPDIEFVHKIEQIVNKHEVVCGMHDLIVHDYGPGRQMISLHAEVPADGNILDIHDEIDLIEIELRETLGCMATIHMDPIFTKDKEVMELKQRMLDLIAEFDSQISMHDFRMVAGKTHTNLIFDLVVPFGFRMEDEQVIQEIQNLVKEKIGQNNYAVICVDKPYM